MPIANLPYPSMDFVPLDVLTADELDQIVANINAINNGVVATASIADGAITTAKIAGGGVSTAKIADGAITPAKMSSAPAPINTSIMDYGAISATTTKVMPSSGFLIGKAVVSASDKSCYISLTNDSTYALGGIPYAYGTITNLQVAFCVPVHKGQTIYFNCSPDNAHFESVNLIQSNFSIA